MATDDPVKSKGRYLKHISCKILMGSEIKDRKLNKLN